MKSGAIRQFGIWCRNTLGLFRRSITVAAGSHTNRARGDLSEDRLRFIQARNKFLLSEVLSLVARRA
jgi:hypothetical protein